MKNLSLLVLFLLLWGFIILLRVPIGPIDRALALGAFAVLLAPYLLFASAEFTAWIRSHSLRWSGIAFPAGLFLAYLLYTLGPGRWDPGSAMVLLLYLALPVLAIRMARGRGKPPNLWDGAAVLLLYLPVQLSLVAPIWTPEDPALRSPAHPFSQLVGMDIMLFCFMAIRALPGIGYTFRIRGRDLLVGVVSFAVFFPVAVLLGNISGFVPFQPHWPDPGSIPGIMLGLTFLVALPEELFFRGIVQNLLQRSFRFRHGGIVSLLATSILFGLSHINNRGSFDWRYVCLATLAGIVYGWVYRTTGKVTASAIPHALTDIVWRLYF